MVFKIIKQDLIAIDSKYVICHCISADCAMGAGVVVPIKNKYKGIKKACIVFTQNKEKSNIVGKAFRYICDAGVVYNLFSKESVIHKAGYGITVEQYHYQLNLCLVDLKEQMLINNERYLAMPKIACGLDKCNWSNVEKIIKDVFKHTDIEILVCEL